LTTRTTTWQQGDRLSCISILYAACINLLFAPLPFRYTPPHPVHLNPVTVHSPKTVA
jgi:hypothetical protein